MYAGALDFIFLKKTMFPEKKKKKLSQIIKRNFKEHTFFLVTSISFDDFSFDFFINPAQKEIINAEIIFGLTVKIKLQPENRLLPIHI